MVNPWPSLHSFVRCTQNKMRRNPVLSHPHLIAAILGLSICCAEGIRMASSDIPVGGLNSGKCRLIFNEVNIFPAGLDQFLELKKVCDADFKPEKQFPINMKFYKIIFVSHDGYLLTACHLTGKVKPKSKGQSTFFTLSGNAIHEPDMIIQSCRFSPDESGYLNSRFPTGEDAPVAVALLYSADMDSIKDVDLIEGPPGNYVRTKIDCRMEKKIRENLQDLLVYTTSSPYTSCEYYKRFYSTNSRTHKEVIRDWGQLYQSSERSLSRCPQPTDPPMINNFAPFQSEYFLHAPITPGKDNLCEESFQFDFESSQPQRKMPRVDFSQGHECSITTDDPAIETLSMISHPIEYSNKLEQRIREFQEQRQLLMMEIVTEGPPNPVDALNTDCEVLGNPLELGKGPLSSFTKNAVSSIDFEQKLTSQQPLILASCNDFQPQELVRTLKIMKEPPIFWQDLMKEDTCSWLEWVPNKSFRCKYCNLLLSQGFLRDRPGSPWITKIMTVGQINKGKHAKSSNRRLLKRHLENPLHKIAVDFIRHFEGGLRGEVLWKEYIRMDGPLRKFTNATENLFAMGYTLAELDSSFHKSPKLRALLDYYGVNTGHVYNNPTGTQRVVTSISKTLHQNLLDHLKEHSPEFSLLIDSSTDVASIPALAIVFQTFDEAKEVKIYLYKVIWINGRETGEHLWQHFLREIQMDGLENYVREKCVGFASDGGSNVLAFREHLKRFTDHGDRMILIHCFAHKSELAMMHAWKSKPFILATEDIVNKLHRIFGCRSAKKKQHLQVTQDELGDSRFSMKRIQKTRWVNSRLRAMDPIIIHWRTIMKALQRVYDDATIKDAKQRQIVKETLDTLKDPTFLVTVAFVTDVFTALSTMSLKLQDRGNSLIGKKEKRERLKSSLLAMKVTNGPFLQSVLDNAKFCSPAHLGKEMTVMNFELGDIIHSGIAMNKPDDSTANFRLYNNRAEYIELLISQLDEYFAVDPTDDFDIFDPSHWPSEDLYTYGNANISLMNNDLKWNFDSAQIISDWVQLKLAVTSHPKFTTNRRDLNPEQFWAFYLKESSIPWSDSLRKILTNVITIPASTAEVERIFSYYTQIKTVRRFNLNVATVDALIRIRFNGPKSISDFDAFPYAWNFVEKHSRADDNSIPVHRNGKSAASVESDEDNSSPPTTGDSFVGASDLSDLTEDSSRSLLAEQDDDVDTNWNRQPTCTNHLSSPVTDFEDDSCINSGVDEPVLREIMAFMESPDEESEVYE